MDTIITRRFGILVLGMHRSGTSATARVISLMGAALPATLMEGAAANVEGHWEPKRLVELNDRILASLGSVWLDWRPVAPPSTEQWLTPVATQVAAQYADQSTFVLKDPRVCLLVPLYQAALASLGIEPLNVMVFRNPYGVSGSLMARDGFSEGYVHLLWLRYVLEAEQATRGKWRTFVRYEDVLKDWRKHLAPLAAAAQLAQPASDTPVGAEIDRFLDPGQRHHAGQAIAGDNRLASWLRLAYGAHGRLALDPQDVEAMRALDGVWAEFSMASEAMGGPFYGEMKRLIVRQREMEAELADLRQREAGLREKIALLTGDAA